MAPSAESEGGSSDPHWLAFTHLEVGRALLPTRPRPLDPPTAPRVDHIPPLYG